MKYSILVADASHALLLATNNIRQGELTLIQRYEHPDSRLRSTELATDRPGKNHLQGSFSGPDPKTTTTEHFALELAHALAAQHVTHQFEQLIIVCPPHFHALLLRHIHSLHNVDRTYLAHDFTKLSLAEIRDRLEEKLFG